MEPQIRKFDSDTILPADIADQVVEIFKENYPETHSPESRERDLQPRASQDALNELLAKGRVIFTAHDIHDKVNSDGMQFMYKNL